MTGLSKSVVTHIINESNRLKVPADLMFAMFDQESSFNPRSRNDIGATGLGQIVHKPGSKHHSGPWIAKLAGKEGEYSLDKLYDPHYNVTLSINYIKWIHDHNIKEWGKAKGDWHSTLTGYWAGPWSERLKNGSSPSVSPHSNKVHEKKGKYSAYTSGSYDNTGTSDEAQISRILEKGDEGADVKKLQEALKTAGYDPGPIDGKFGSKTLKALKEFQMFAKKVGEDVDATGKVDAKTLVLLGLDKGGGYSPTSSSIVSGDGIGTTFSDVATWGTVGAQTDAFSNTPHEYIDRKSATEQYISKRKITQSGGAGQLPFHGAVEGVAPLHDDDVFPGYRKMNYDRRDFLRVGDSMFVMPPEYINVHSETKSVENHILRQKEPMRLKQGRLMQSVTITMFFNGVNQINGYEMKAPSGIGGKWYMDGLRPLLAQFKRMPFLPVKNEYLNHIHDIWALSLRSISVETVEGFPHLLKATLICHEFNTEPFIGAHSALYDKFIMYPLFRFWYQKQMRMTEAGEFESHTFLEPMRNISENASTGIEFGVLREEFLMSDLGKKGAGTGNQPTVPYIDKQEQMYERVMLRDTCVMTNIAAVCSNIVSPMHMDAVGKPAYQYMGGLSTRFQATFETIQAEDVHTLKLLQQRCEELQRKYGQKGVTGYVEVNHQFVNFFGTQFISIEDMEVETMGPSHFRIHMQFVSYNNDQRQSEAMYGFNPFTDATEQQLQDGHFLYNQLGGVDEKGHQNIMTQEVMAEHMMNGMELYPDLELPTYADTAKAIDAINATRKHYGLTPLPIDGTGFNKLKPVMTGKKPAFVDPDFFMAYRDISTFEEVKELKETKISETMSKVFEGNEALTTDGPKSAGMAVNPANALGKYTRLKEIAMDVNNFSKAMRDIGQEGNAGWTIGQPPNGMELFGRMSHDMFRYGKKGRLVRAFPTYALLIIDEGQWFNAKKLWSNYYGYHAAVDMTVVRDKKTPIDTLHLKLSNIYNTLDSKSQVLRDAKDPNKYGFWETIWANFMPTIEKDKLTQRAKLSQNVKVRAGCRIHLRMGYGSTATELGTVFNGTIMDIGVGPEVEVIAQSDGIELTNVLPYSPDAKSTMYEQGAEPKDIIAYYLHKRSKPLWYAMFGGGYGAMESRFGIEHFGFIVDNNGSHGFAKWVKAVFDEDYIEDYDLTKNIYTGTTYGRTIDKMKVDSLRSNSYDPDSGSVANEETGGWDWGESFWRSIVNQVTPPKPEEINTFKIWLYGKSSWDIFRSLTLATPNYIIATDYHNLHSTLFFGMPHWQCVSSWFVTKPEDVGKPEQYRELVKPFQQLHIFDAHQDIITNGIKASSRRLTTIGIPLYTYDDKSETTDSVYADPNIRTSLQRTKIVDTSIIQNTPVDWMISLGRNIFGDQDTLGEKHAKKFTASVLKESFNEMYQGELVVIGDPSVKPHDKIYISDLYNQMMGAADVGRVVHMFGFSTGMVTSIKPDLTTVVTDHEFAVDVENIATSIIPVAGAIGYVSVRAMMYHQQVQKGLAASATVSSLTRVGWASTGFNVLKNLGNVFRVGVAVGSAVPGIGWLTAIAGLGIWAGLTYLTKSISKHLGKAKGSLRIYPLIYRDQPFVAGIDGQRTLIPAMPTTGGDNANIDFGNELEAINIKGGSFDSSAQAFSSGTRPVDEPRITSPLGLRWGKQHVGIDVGGKAGTPIKSINSGTVVKAFKSSNYGNVVMIDHGNKIVSLYAHMQDGSLTVSEGQSVGAGTVIGKMGTTGHSTGVHLHIEVLRLKKDPPNGYNIYSWLMSNRNKYATSIQEVYKYAEVLDPTPLLQ